MAVACVVRDRAAAALAEARRGFAILASPRAYLVRVALPQLMAWVLRVLAMYCFLHAFHIDGQMNHAALALLAGSVDHAGAADAGRGRHPAGVARGVAGGRGGSSRGAVVQASARSW